MGDDAMEMGLPPFWQMVVEGTDVVTVLRVLLMRKEWWAERRVVFGQLLREGSEFEDKRGLRFLMERVGDEWAVPEGINETDLVLWCAQSSFLRGMFAHKVAELSRNVLRMFDMGGQVSRVLLHYKPSEHALSRNTVGKQAQGWLGLDGQEEWARFAETNPDRCYLPMQAGLDRQGFSPVDSDLVFLTLVAARTPTRFCQAFSATSPSQTRLHLDNLAGLLSRLARGEDPMPSVAQGRTESSDGERLLLSDGRQVSLPYALSHQEWTHQIHANVVEGLRRLDQDGVAKVHLSYMLLPSGSNVILPGQRQFCMTIRKQDIPNVYTLELKHNSVPTIMVTDLQALEQCGIVPLGLVTPEQALLFDDGEQEQDEDDSMLVSW